MDGLQGPIVITDPSDPQEKALQSQYDEEILIWLQDWYHRSGSSMRTGLDNVPFIWVGDPDSFLINGKGMYTGCIGVNTTVVTQCDANCTESNYLAAVNVTKGKKYLLRIINAAALLAVNFAIANHTMQVVQVEGTFVDPVTVETLDIGIAERYSVLLDANQDSSQSYWMSTGVRFRSSGPTGLAYLQYEGAAEPDLAGYYPVHPVWNDTTHWSNFTSLLNTTTPSKYATYGALSANPDKNMVVVGNQAINNATGALRWVANNYSATFPATPIILSAYQAVNSEGALSWPKTQTPGIVNLPDYPLSPWNYTETMQDAGAGTNLNIEGNVIVRLVNGSVVELVLQNARSLNGAAEYHSWHLHGHTFWLIGQGLGDFNNESDPANFNLNNPVMRDTVALLPEGWAAVRFLADNPGAWAFHCAISPHLVMGMGFTVVTSPDLLPPPPPGVGSCLLTSLNVSDSQVCDVLTQQATSAAMVSHFPGNLLMAAMLSISFITLVM